MGKVSSVPPPATALITPAPTAAPASSLSDFELRFFEMISTRGGPGESVNPYMAARFVNIDYDTPLFLPPNLRDWVPAGHLAHFILDSVEEMDLRQVRVNDRGSGCPQYPPRMMLALLLYCYVTGVFSSRRIQRAALESVPVRMICGDTHPDHDTICTFRRENQALLQETFVRVLELAQELKFLQLGQIAVAVDGTKVLANASKHAPRQTRHKRPTNVAMRQPPWSKTRVGNFCQSFARQ
jgi:transposase